MMVRLNHRRGGVEGIYWCEIQLKTRQSPHSSEQVDSPDDFVHRPSLGGDE